MTDREAMQMALEALEHHTVQTRPIRHTDRVIAILTQALAQPRFDTPESHIVKWSIPVDSNNFGEKEPVAYINHGSGKPKLIDGYVVQTDCDIPLYTAPPKQWVGLTDEEIEVIAKRLMDDAAYCSLHFAVAIEAKLKEKNGGV